MLSILNSSSYLTEKQPSQAEHNNNMCVRAHRASPALVHMITTDHKVKTLHRYNMMWNTTLIPCEKWKWFLSNESLGIFARLSKLHDANCLGTYLNQTVYDMFRSGTTKERSSLWMIVLCYKKETLVPFFLPKGKEEDPETSGGVQVAINRYMWIAYRQSHICYQSMAIAHVCIFSLLPNRETKIFSRKSRNKSFETTSGSNFRRLLYERYQKV